MAGPDGDALRHNVVCPFCGLACDDLTIGLRSGRIEVREAGCALSRQSFERRVPETEPCLGGRGACLDDAIGKAAEILRTSTAPLFAGLATDVAGARAAMRLAERIGGIVDHLGSEGLFRNLRVVQDSGWITTTLSEVRNHADFLLVVGADPTPLFPRFFERCTERRETLYSDTPAAPRVVRLGPQGDLDCAIDRLPEAVSALRCMVSGRPVNGSNGADLPSAQLHALADQLTSAKYGVIVWVAGTFDFSGAGMLTHALADLIRDLNLTTRCAALPLTGSDNVVGVNQVCTWQSGVPLRTGFGRGVPQHDPLLNTTERLLAEQEVDALVWISAFRPLPPPEASVPTIVLAAPDLRFPRTPDVFIPVATPGVDHAGDIFRTDGVVALHLASLMPGALPSVATVLDRIASILDDETEA